MTANAATDHASQWWRSEGRRIGRSLDAAAALVVAGRPDDAAGVALGIGAVQALRRRVVVADLADETPALTRLLTGDDPHGVSDAFRYGVSLNRIAHPVADEPNLFVLPSGTESVIDDEIYANDRWRRLVAGFREMGALLLLVAPDDAPALASLVAFTDGVVAVGNVAVPGNLVEAAAAPPRARALPSRAAHRAAGDSPGARTRTVPRWAVATGASAIAAGLLIGAVVARRHSDEVTARHLAAAAALPDSAALPHRSVDSAAAIVAPDVPPIRNIGDSAQATGYGIELAKFSTATGALIRVRDELPKNTAAPTFGVVAIGADGTLWYRVVAGAAATRRSADSLLAALRASRAADDSTAGAIVAVPFAFRLQQSVDASAAPALVGQYLARGVPAYALRQTDGTVTLYAGAFESAEQAALYTNYLRAAGVEPALTYRIGRAL